MKSLDMVKVRLVPDYKLQSDMEIKSVEQAVELLGTELSQFDREALCIVNLNAAAKPINASIVSLGDGNSTNVHPREVFKCAILSSAAAIILMHNHPSGELNPSNDDITVTSRLISAGKLLGIRVIDHVIVGPNMDYYSMRDRGLIEDLEQSPVKMIYGNEQEQSNFQIQRMIEGEEELLPLTRTELSSAYFTQQKEFDQEYILEYLEAIERDPRESQIFKLKHDISVKKVLSSESLVQKLASEFRRQKNKQESDDSFLTEDVLEKELAEIPKRKRKGKYLER